jgi:NDP-sugar pyrophosphorylase family protein
VLLTGYGADALERQVQDGSAWDLQVEYSKEASPLGTAGAIKLAEPRLKRSCPFLVLNGDSFIDVDFGELVRFHRAHGGVASMAVVRVPNAARYGTVVLGDLWRVKAFAEKHASDAAGLVNAGIYVFDSRIFDHLPAGPASLERDVFPELLAHGVYAQEHCGLFIDIGTPEDYARAQRISQRLYDAALDGASAGRDERYSARQAVSRKVPL